MLRKINLLILLASILIYVIFALSNGTVEPWKFGQNASTLWGLAELIVLVIFVAVNLTFIIPPPNDKDKSSKE